MPADPASPQTRQNSGQPAQPATGTALCPHQGAQAPAGRRRAFLCLAILAAITALAAFYMLGAGSMLLSEPDEARCALIARHMVTSGDWLAPQLLDRPYFDKPPLYFWMLAASVRTFGQSEWALRLPSAIIGAVTVVLTGLLALQLFGRRAALIAGGTFAVSIAGLMAARVVRMDMLLALWITASLLCWVRASLPSRPAQGVPLPEPSGPGTKVSWSSCRLVTMAPCPSSPQPLFWYVMMYICMALGCLTKGPVAILLPVLIIVLYLALSRPIRDLPRGIWRLRPLTGMMIIAVTYGSWVAYMTWRYPQYPQEFFWRQNVDRFGGSGLDATAAWWVIPGAFLGGLMPWAAVAGLAAWDRRPRRGIPPAEKLLWIWGLAVLVFFTLSRARLPNYILPAFPSTFALMGGYLSATGERHRAQLRIGVIATFVIALAGVIAWAIVERQRFERPDLLRAAVRLGTLLALIAPTWLLWRRRPALALLPFFIAYVGFTVEFAYGPAQQYLASRCTKDLAAPLAPLDPATAGEIVMATEPRYGAMFYAPPGWRFRLVSTARLGSLVPVLATSDRPLYAILTGGGLLRSLQRDEIRGVRIRDRLTILQTRNSDALVRIAPAAGGGVPLRSPQSRRAENSQPR
jgi:4-amino-4-deoxy-L-arabinose transferase-like glycosyltransferase